MKSVLVAGSSGLVGSELVNRLQNDPTIGKIMTLVRKRNSLNHPKILKAEVDFNHLGQAGQLFNGIDTVFCCLGTTMKKAGTKAAFRLVDHDYPLSLAQIAASHGVSSFLCITAMGADPGSRIFYNRVKGEVEQDIGTLAIPSIVFFRPSLLLGERKENRPGERIGIAVARALSFLFTGPLKNYRGIEAGQVAAAMIRAAKDNSPGVRVVLSGAMQQEK